MHNRERTKAFALAYADRPLRAIDALVVAEWLKGGRNMGTVPALRRCSTARASRTPDC